MPLVKVEIIKGKSIEYKKTLLDCVHSALVKAFKIPDEDRIQRLYELDAIDFEYSSNKTSDIILIGLTIFKGRSFTAKKLLYHEMVTSLSNHLGISRNDIVIVLHEVPLENWGIRGGNPGNEVNLEFKIDV